MPSRRRQRRRYEANEETILIAEIERIKQIAKRNHDKIEVMKNKAKEADENNEPQKAKEIRNQSFKLFTETEKMIKDAHNGPFYLDLHFLSRDVAVAFFKEQFERLPRGCCMKIVTGKDKPEKITIYQKVTEVLEDANIPFTALNPGFIKFKKR